MKLADYLHLHGIAPGQLRRMLGVKSRTTVLRYLHDEQVPRPDVLARIEEITEGQVKRSDFLDPKPPKCAAVIVDGGGKRRYVFPWSTRERDTEAALRTVLAEPRESDVLSPPIRRALAVLGPRAMPLPKGVFMLDGRQVDAQTIVAKANAILRHRGGSPIHYPGVHPKW